MHFIKRAASRALAAKPAGAFIRAAPRSSTPFAIRQQTAVISAFRRFNSTESTPVNESTQVEESVSADGPVSADASEQSSVTSAVSSATGGSPSATTKSSQEFREGIAPNNTIYVGNLLFEATPEDLMREFSPYGEIESVKIAQDSRGLSKGFAYVEFKSIDNARDAIKERHLSDFEGRRLIVNYMAKSRSSGDRNPKNPPAKTLFIGNLPFEMTDADLNTLFRDISNVIDVRVAIDRRTGQPRGFAHADFVDVESAVKAAKALEGKEVYNRALRVDYSLSVHRQSSGGQSGRRAPEERSNF